MATRIVFTGAELNMVVVEDLSEVHTAMLAAQNGPFRLTSQSLGEVYVNPENIAYWHKYGK
jgi:hypothetical protein